MTQEEYMASIGKHLDTPVSDFLQHGGEWKKHKYIRIENGRYIYPEDDEAAKLRKFAGKHDERAKEHDSTAKIDRKIANGARYSDTGERIAKTKDDVEYFKKSSEKYAREASVLRSMASGKRRTADLLEGQANIQRHEDTKNDPNNQATQNARRESDESAKKAEKQMEGYEDYKKTENYKYTTDEKNRYKDSDYSKLNSAQKKAIEKRNNEMYAQFVDDLEAQSRHVNNGGKKFYAKVIEKAPDGSPAYVKAYYRDSNGHEVDTGWFYDYRKPTYGEINDYVKKHFTSVNHSSTPMSRDEFYAAVYDYKQKH